MTEQELTDSEIEAELALVKPPTKLQQAEKLAQFYRDNIRRSIASFKTRQKAGPVSEADVAEYRERLASFESGVEEYEGMAERLRGSSGG